MKYLRKQFLGKVEQIHRGLLPDYYFVARRSLLLKKDI